MKENHALLKSVFLSTLFVLGIAACSPAENNNEKPGGEEKPQQPLTIEVSVEDVTSNTAFVSFKTSHDESTYYSSVMTKAEYDKLGSEDAVFKEDKEFFKYIARKEGKTYEQVVDFMLNTGSQEEKFVNLISNTAYYAYAYEMNRDGEVTGGISVEEFRTAEQPGEPITFNLRMEEYGDKYATVYVTPSTDTVWCVTGFLPKSVVAEYGGSIQAIKLFAMEYLLSQAEFGGLDVEDIVDIFCQKGEFVFEEDQLTPETPYYAYVVAVDDYGKPISDVCVYEFQTPKEGYIGFDIDIEVENYRGTAVSAEFITSDGKNTYFYNRFSADLVESFDSDEELQAWIVDDMGYSLRYWLVTGRTKTEFVNLLADTDYYVVAFGYSKEDERVTTPIFKKKFTAPVPEGLSFDISIEMIKMGAMATVFPGDNFTPYVCGFVDKAMYDEYGGDFESMFKAQVEKKMEMNPDLTKEKAILSLTNSGQEFFTQQYLYSNTQYYFWVSVVDGKCEFPQEPEVKEFVSKTHVLNDDYVTVESKFFDGKEIADKSFFYRPYEDYAILYVNVTPSSEGVSYVPWVYAGDLENNTEEYTDDEIRYDLINYKAGYISRQIVYIIPWDTEFTLCVATVNQALECGKVYRKTMTLHKDNVNPAEEFKALYEYPVVPEMSFGKPSSVKESSSEMAAPIRKSGKKQVADMGCKNEVEGAVIPETPETVRFAMKMVKERLF